MATEPAQSAPSGEPGEKGLRGDALGFASNVVIGVASTAPGYSLAAVLAFIVAAVGVQAPAIMIVAFIPMLMTAAAYYYLNRADPDAGTTFSWVTRALGPWTGWIGGWAIVVADIIVMANLAEIAAIYTYDLVGYDDPSKWAVLALGCGWIALMTWICYVGIEASARTQYFLLTAEIVTLLIFAAVALWKVYTEDIPGSIDPSLSWFNPFAIDDFSALVAAFMLAIFIYWGWDSTVTVNEESKDATEGPGKAAVVATLILLGVYLIVTVAAVAYAGVDRLSGDESGDALGLLGTDVLGSPLDNLLIIAVLTSAAASTQTTILPTTRTTLSMAAKGAAPRYFARIHPSHLTPSTSTIWMGVASIAWYVFLKIVSENILLDAIAGLGLMIAFYYGLTGFACAVYYRTELRKSTKNLLLMGVVPVIGGLVLAAALVKSIYDLSKPENSESGDSWLGLGPPLVIGVGLMLVGVVLMFLQWRANPAFFQRKRETVPPEVALRGSQHALDAETAALQEKVGD
jgi:amino acid transporter